MFKVGCQSTSLEFPILQESHYQQPLAHHRPRDARAFCVCTHKGSVLVDVFNVESHKKGEGGEGGSQEEEEKDGYLRKIGHCLAELRTWQQIGLLLLMITAVYPN